MKDRLIAVEEGEPNFWMIKSNHEWVARIQLNGQLTLPTQRLMMGELAESLNKKVGR